MVYTYGVYMCIIFLVVDLHIEVYTSRYIHMVYTYGVYMCIIFLVVDLHIEVYTFLASRVYVYVGLIMINL